eukprot:11825787-Alexandrium_andersonii.AAC.1
MRVLLGPRPTVGPVPGTARAARATTCAATSAAARSSARWPVSQTQGCSRPHHGGYHPPGLSRPCASAPPARAASPGGGARSFFNRHE